MPGVHFKMNELSSRILRTAAGTRVKETLFPSGAIMLHVWRSGRLFVMFYGESGRFGVDEVMEDEGFDMGYRHLFDDIESASAMMLQLVAAATAKAASELKFGT